MRFRKLILRNIGPYYGSNELDFSQSREGQNVILIGGKNGAGKTTLLEAFKIALFGSAAFGYKHLNQPYLRKIRALLNRRAVREGESHFQIIVELDWVDQYEQIVYKVNRSWTLSKDSLREMVQVFKNGTIQNEQQTDLFLNRLRDEMPPQLFEICFFDGEEVAKTITQGKLPEYLHGIAQVLFHMNLFESLEQDLRQYQKIQTSETEALQQDLLELDKLRAKVAELKKRKSQLEHDIEKDCSVIDENKAEMNLLEHRFVTHGGIREEQRKQLISEEQRIIQTREQNIGKIKDFISGLLPFCLTRNLLREVRDQMKKEESYETYYYLSNTLTEDKLQYVVDVLKARGMLAEGRETEVLKALAKEFLKLFEPEQGKPIHRASFDVRSQVAALLREVETIDPREYADLILSNQQLLQQKQKISKKLDTFDNTHELKDLLYQIHSLQKENEQLALKIEKTKDQLSQVQNELNLAEQEMERLKKKWLSSKRNTTTIDLAERLILVSQMFRWKQIRHQLHNVEVAATRMINRLLRKSNEIAKITIDPVNYELNVFNKALEPIPKERLSAGEQQILLLSVIWAMFHCSKRRLPFVFDTLLGRLDQLHRERILTKFIPSCSKQVIILSTDTEINRAYYEMLRPYLANIYTLEYIDGADAVHISKGCYFDYPVEMVR